MKTYYIYNILTDEFLGTIEAESVDKAELKFAQQADTVISSLYIAAFSEKQ